MSSVLNSSPFALLRGQEFRTDFKDLSAVRAFFSTCTHHSPYSNCTTRFADKIVKEFVSEKQYCKTVAANPNRAKIYFDKKLRMSNHHAYEGYDHILLPIANELSVQREKYQMTIIYLKLKYCGYAYALFEHILKDEQYVGETCDPAARLFDQFHAPQTKHMKESIISEIKKEDSRIGVLFATSALVWELMHLTSGTLYTSHPQTTLNHTCKKLDVLGEQDCHPKQLFISTIQTFLTTRSMCKKQWSCRSQETCLRNLSLEYLGFCSVKQKNCCCICDGKCSSVVEVLPVMVNNKVRILPSENKLILEELIHSELYETHASECVLLLDAAVEADLARKIIN